MTFIVDFVSFLCLLVLDKVSFDHLTLVEIRSISAAVISSAVICSAVACC